MVLLSVQPGFSCPDAALWRPLPSVLPSIFPSIFPSIPYVTEYRHGDKTIETEELASLSTRLEETKASLVFSKNTNSPLYSSIKKRYSPMDCLCYKHYQKLQFVQKIKRMSHLTCISQMKGEEVSDRFACLCGPWVIGSLSQSDVLKVL